MAVDSLSVLLSLSVCGEVEKCSQILDNTLFCFLKAPLLLGSKLECSIAKHASVVSNHHRNRHGYIYVLSRAPRYRPAKHWTPQKGVKLIWSILFIFCVDVFHSVPLGALGEKLVSTCWMCSRESPLCFTDSNAKPLLDSQNLAPATDFEFPWMAVIKLSGICVHTLCPSALRCVSFKYTLWKGPYCRCF